MKRMMTILAALGLSGAAKATAHTQYIACTYAARNPFFYTDCGVADDLYGRLEMLMLHVSLIMIRLQQHPEIFTHQPLHLAEAFFRDMDHTMREMAVSDLRVGGKVKRTVGVLYGRMDAYEAALKSSDHALQKTLARNVFSKSGASTSDGLQKLTAYTRKAAARLTALSNEAILAASSELFTRDE